MEGGVRSWGQQSGMHLFSQGSLREESGRRAGDLGTQTDVDKSAVSFVLAEYPRGTEVRCRGAGLLSSKCNWPCPLLHGIVVTCEPQTCLFLTVKIRQVPQPP